MRLPNKRPQCSAHSKQTGRRCGLAAIPGGTVCRLHGGSAPQVIEAARRRLIEALGVSAEVILTILEDPAADPKLKLEAGDRAWKWSGALNEPTVQVQVQAPHEGLSEAQLAETIRRIKASL